MESGVVAGLVWLGSAEYANGRLYKGDRIKLVHVAAHDIGANWRISSATAENIFVNCTNFFTKLRQTGVVRSIRLSFAQLGEAITEVPCRVCQASMEIDGADVEI
jgi:hypothetical protein